MTKTSESLELVTKVKRRLRMLEATPGRTRAIEVLEVTTTAKRGRRDHATGASATRPENPAPATKLLTGLRRNNNRSLNDSQVREVRVAFKAGIAIAALRKQYAVDRTVIRDIVEGRTYKDVR